MCKSDKTIGDTFESVDPEKCVKTAMCSLALYKREEVHNRVLCSLYKTSKTTLSWRKEMSTVDGISQCPPSHFKRSTVQEYRKKKLAKVNRSLGI